MYALVSMTVVEQFGLVHYVFFYAFTVQAQLDRAVLERVHSAIILKLLGAAFVFFTFHISLFSLPAFHPSHPCCPVWRSIKNVKITTDVCSVHFYILSSAAMMTMLWLRWNARRVVLLDFGSC